MDSLNFTPEQLADKVSKKQVPKMELKPLLLSFKGRIGRKQFLKWYIPLWLLPLVIALYSKELGGYFFLATLWFLFALTTKRYHDFGKAGWAGLFQLIPGIGGVLIVLAGCGITIGDFNDNQYGKSLYRK